MERGWLRTKRSNIHGGPNLLAVLITAKEIAAGLQYLHALDIIHGDLSAYNVMLSSASPDAVLGNRGFVAKIADFGLSRRLDMKSSITTKTYGTITHMPPEVLGDGAVSKAADVYAFGVLLWQMYTSSRPWAGMGHAAIIKAVAIESKTLQFPDDTPDAVRELAKACMVEDPAERPTIGDVLDVLAPLASM